LDLKLHHHNTSWALGSSRKRRARYGRTRHADRKIAEPYVLPRKMPPLDPYGRMTQWPVPLFIPQSWAHLWRISFSSFRAAPGLSLHLQCMLLQKTQGRDDQKSRAMAASSSLNLFALLPPRRHSSPHAVPGLVSCMLQSSSCSR
jgi:hypothetical protein